MFRSRLASLLQGRSVKRTAGGVALVEEGAPEVGVVRDLPDRVEVVRKDGAKEVREKPELATGLPRGMRVYRIPLDAGGTEKEQAVGPGAISFLFQLPAARNLWDLGPLTVQFGEDDAIPIVAQGQSLVPLSTDRMHSFDRVKLTWTAMPSGVLYIVCSTMFDVRASGGSALVQEPAEVIGYKASSSGWVAGTDKPVLIAGVGAGPSWRAFNAYIRGVSATMTMYPDYRGTMGSGVIAVGAAATQVAAASTRQNRTFWLSNMGAAAITLGGSGTVAGAGYTLQAMAAVNSNGKMENWEAALYAITAAGPINLGYTWLESD